MTMLSRIATIRTVVCMLATFVATPSLITAAYAEKPKTALKKRYADSFGACGLPSAALNIIASDFVGNISDVDTLKVLPGSSTLAFFKFYSSKPSALMTPPAPVHTFKPRSQNAQFLWLPLPTDGTGRHVGLMSCRTLFEMALDASVDIKWAEAQAAAKLRKQKKGRFTGRYGRLESPIWRRLHSNTVAQSNMRFLLWHSLAEKWSTKAPAKLWTLSQVEGYTFDTWEQVAFSGNASLDLDQGLDTWFFEEQLTVDVRTDVGGTANNWTSVIAADPTTATWEPLPSVAEQKKALESIVPERDPEVHGDDTALQGQTFRNVRVIPGVPQILCDPAFWLATWQDVKIPEPMANTVTWNPKGGYCSFSAATKIPGSAYPKGGGNSTYPFAIRWTFKETVDSQSPSIAVQASVPLEGDLVISTEKNAYESIAPVNGRGQVVVKVQISDPKQRLNLGQQLTLNWPKDACGWMVSGPRQAKFEGNTFTVEVVFEQPGSTTVGTQTPRCSIEPTAILPAFDNLRSPTTIDRLFYVLIDLPSLASQGPSQSTTPQPPGSNAPPPSPTPP